MDINISLTFEKKHVYLIAAFLAVAAMLVPISAWAADSFDDVPDSNIFHDDIAWMADAGITKGCNPPANTKFCPDSNVTRGQMAAFMHRFADASLIRTASAVSEKAFAFPGPMINQTLVSTNIVAPVDGFLLINANADVWRSDAGWDSYQCSITLNLVTTFGPGSGSVDGSGAWQDTCNALAYEPVSAGSHTVGFKVALVDAGTFFEAVLLNVMFVPAN